LILFAVLVAARQKNRMKILILSVLPPKTPLVLRLARACA